MISSFSPCRCMMRAEEGLKYLVTCDARYCNGKVGKVHNGYLEYQYYCTLNLIITARSLAKSLFVFVIHRRWCRSWSLTLHLELFRHLDRGIVFMFRPENGDFTPAVPLGSPDGKGVQLGAVHVAAQHQHLVRGPAVPPALVVAGLAVVGAGVLRLELAAANGVHGKDAAAAAARVALVLHPPRVAAGAEVLVPAAPAAHPGAEPVPVQGAAHGHADADERGAELGGVPDDDADHVLEVVGAAQLLELNGALDAARARQHAQAHGDADDHLFPSRHIEVPQQPPGEGGVEEIDNHGPAAGIGRNVARVDRAGPVEPPVPQVGDRDAREPKHKERGDDGGGEEEVGDPDGDLVAARGDEAEEEEGERGF